MEAMNGTNERQSAEEGELDDEALGQTTGGTGVAHELAHVQQQGAGVGANETITVGGNRTISVGTTPKK